jgi:hypothetical protein
VGGGDGGGRLAEGTGRKGKWTGVVLLFEGEK